jgi:hypothetical protein
MKQAAQHKHKTMVDGGGESSSRDHHGTHNESELRS